MCNEVMYCMDCHCALHAMDNYCSMCGKSTYKNKLTGAEVVALGKPCYECGKRVKWLAPDSRCKDCTGYTPEMIRDGEDIHDV